MATPKYTKPASQVDLEARQKDGYEPGTVVNHGVDSELSDNGYVGVDPIYQNSANLDHPMDQGDKTAEGKLMKSALSDDVEYPELEDVEAGEDEDESKNPPTPPAPPSN